MQRAILLAHLGTKAVKDNPYVGSVLVHDDRIIGEGYHMINGKAHAEVDCIQSVKEEDRHLIADSCIYVTLEPCHHTGKTPPCVDLIIKHGIKKIVIGIEDPNPKVSGKSVVKLKDLGVDVSVGICEEECEELIRPFIKMMTRNRPWVQLKFAKSKFNYMAGNESQVWLSSAASKLYVHRMRANVDAIMIGTNTAMMDDPALTTRIVDGENPVRVVLDRQGILPDHLQLFNDGHPTIYVTSIARTFSESVQVLIHDFEQDNHLDQLLSELYQKGIYRLMIEGGAALLRSIAKNKLWDEAVVIHTPHALNEGKRAPNLMGRLVDRIDVDTDRIDVIRR